MTPQEFKELKQNISPKGTIKWLVYDENIKQHIPAEKYYKTGLYEYGFLTTVGKPP